MTSIAFLLGVIGFVVVAYWAYTNDRLKVGGGEQGLLAMKSDTRQPEGPPSRATWLRDGRPPKPRGPKRPALEPRYRRSLQGRPSGRR